MKTVLNFSRIIVGVLFIFSGLIKADDPLGLAYKMQEFFDVWAQEGFLPGLMRAMDSYALAFSIIIIAFEIVAGFAVLLKWRMNLISWLLLILIIFFSFLTGYAYLSGKFRSCGCFGDCIPITPGVSFSKDLILLVLILLIFSFRRRIKPANASGGLWVFLALLFSFGLQWYILKHLPIVDCLPFKVGNNIPEKMKIPPGALPDSTVISFLYKKDGKDVEFTADKFPDDFDDSIYHFVKRYDKLIRKGNAEAPIKDFNLKTLSGIDTTKELLSTPGYSVLLFMKDIDEAGTSWLDKYRAIQELCYSKNINSYIITSSTADKISEFNLKFAFLRAQFLTCDPVPVKTAARADPTLILVNQGTIEGKWSYADFNSAIKKMKSLMLETKAN